MLFGRLRRSASVRAALAAHFRCAHLHQLVTATRTYPVTARVDVQRALDHLFAERYPARLLGIHPDYAHQTLAIADLTTPGHWGARVAPVQHEEIDIGETLPARCVVHGLWLARDQHTSFAVLLTPAIQHGCGAGLHLEVAVCPGEPGNEVVRAFFDEVDRWVSRAGAYRGKVLSLEATIPFSGQPNVVKVHRLPPVPREALILPERTLRLLDRNITEFVQQRDRLANLKMSLKKGLLFYGPPGTGKTYCIQYLAGVVRDHTTLLITAEQAAFLDRYFQLARFLEPAIVVVEDVDLIARARDHMRSVYEESLLNQLLNEMDGLREDARLLVILTTNRPDQLEPALTARPGRIDQAIEFPLPDEACRRKLVRLYARGLPLSEPVTELIVRKTQGASPAFIKELMRRAAQYHLAAGGQGGLAPGSVEAALDEMLFSGGSLNVKLLGGPATA